MTTKQSEFNSTPINNEKDLVSIRLTNTFEIEHIMIKKSSINFNEFIEKAILCTINDDTLINEILEFDYSDEKIFRADMYEYHTDEYNWLASKVASEVYDMISNDIVAINYAIDIMKKIMTRTFIVDCEESDDIFDNFNYGYFTDHAYNSEFRKSIDRYIEEIGTRIFKEELEKNPNIGKLPLTYQDDQKEKINKLNELLNSLDDEELNSIIEQHLSKRKK